MVYNNWLDCWRNFGVPEIWSVLWVLNPHECKIAMATWIEHEQQHPHRDHWRSAHCGAVLHQQLRKCSTLTPFLFCWWNRSAIFVSCEIPLYACQAFVCWLHEFGKRDSYFPEFKRKGAFREASSINFEIEIENNNAADAVKTKALV